MGSCIVCDTFREVASTLGDSEDTFTSAYLTGLHVGMQLGKNLIHPEEVLCEEHRQVYAAGEEGARPLEQPS